MSEACFHLRHGPVDVHAHMTPAEFPPDPCGEPRWPCMQRQSWTDATVMIADKPFRQLDERSWDVKRRIEDMDRDGIAAQALSPMPELLSYWFAADAAEAFADIVNADLAHQVSLAPSRFVGLGTVPMQEPELAVRHLRRVKEVYGLAGIEIGSNINGKLLGDPAFEPIFAAAADLGLAVFVHALHPVATRGLEVPPPFVNLVGFPVDVGMTAASLIMAGTLDRHPGLRIGFSHGGGALAPLLHRMEIGGKFAPGVEAPSPAATARRMYFDSNVYSPAWLRHIAENLSPGRILLGTDYPYLIMQTDPVGYVRSAGLPEAATESLLWGAAHAFLGAAGSRVDI